MPGDIRGVLAVIGACLLVLPTPSAMAAGGGCTSNLDCKGGRVCVSGDCVDPPKPCGKDVDCPGDWVCADHHCGPSAVPAPAAPAPAAPQPAPRPHDACRDGCQAERNECIEQADAKAANCISAAKDSKHARMCTAQSQDEHGQCGEEYSTCAGACK